MALNGTSAADIQEQEWIHFKSVLRTFQSYKTESLSRVHRSIEYLDSLPEHQQLCLNTYRADLEAVKSCIEHNATVVEIMTRDATGIFENVGAGESNSASASYGAVGEIIPEGIDKVQATLKQLVRDWSSLGAVERAQCYQPLIDEIERIYPKDSVDVSKIKVLVPGSGLGRLAFEIASRGFICQGNEFNLFMLIISYFILNCCHEVNMLSIHPWIQQHVNNLSVEHQISSVSFPDVLPAGSARASTFSMAAGDFLEAYKQENEWDCVATCFFIDCASNVVAFIETIYKVLVKGGVWINLGPLLYHYSGTTTHPSIEPSFEALKKVILGIGFEFEKCETGIKSRYCQNPNSMLQYEYDSVFFVCRKY